MNIWLVGLKPPDPGTHQRGEEEEEGAPSYELLIQGHTWGEKEKEKEKEEKKRRRREDKRRSQLRTSHPGTRQEGGDGVAAEVHELVVVEIHNSHYTPSVNGFDLCHPLSEDCCCQWMAASPCGYCDLKFFFLWKNRGFVHRTALYYTRSVNGFGVFRMNLLSEYGKMPAHGFTHGRNRADGATNWGQTPVSHWMFW